MELLRFGPPVTHVYNPLVYAWPTHREYLVRYGKGPKRVVFVGMNPGPFGMAQTGVPFGEVAAVRGWLGLDGEVQTPAQAHPKRPVEGFNCPRSEVSGRRLWGLFAKRFGTAHAFFIDHFVVNYCPLLFLQASGCNCTPDKLAKSELQLVQNGCDRHLRRVLRELRPKWVIGIGQFAFGRVQAVAGESGVQMASILHPSPASPASNRDWEGTVIRQLQDLGVWR
jgi:single-strand selective monofunctional uracil DNA glycosylase